MTTDPSATDTSEEEFVCTRPSALDEALWACDTNPGWSFLWAVFKWVLLCVCLCEVVYLSWYHFSLGEVIVSTFICILCGLLWRLPSR